jgi:tetratricopeptide (TPR) repeat protein
MNLQIRLFGIYWMILILAMLSFPTHLKAAEDVVTLLREADAHYNLRPDRSEVDKAIEMYRNVLALDPSNYEAAWKLSKAYWYIGNHSPKEKKKEYFELGVKAAEQAIQINPNDCRGHFWLGVNYGHLAEVSNWMEALRLVDRIKDAIANAERLDPNCECGGPNRVLGKLYARAPFFKGGSKSKAIRLLKDSLRQCPSDTQSRIFLAEIYLDQKNKSLAIQQLKLVLKQEPDPNWVPETRDNQSLAEQMLAGLNKRHGR